MIFPFKKWPQKDEFFFFREPDGPEVELFDLDEALSSQRVRLAQITNRCRPDEITDLEVSFFFVNYFIFLIVPFSRYYSNWTDRDEQ